MKTCPKCGKNIEKNFEFCPYCGKSLDDNNSWGILGKNDDVFEKDQFPGFGGGIFNKMIGNAMKMLERELKKGKRESQVTPKTKVQLYINGKKVNLGTPKQTKIKRTIKKIKGKPSTYLSKENQKRFTNLPREEPKTNVRRLSDRIIYDIEMPDVKSVKDVSIVNFENSIEIRAIGKNKAYYKVIKISLPIIDYYLDKGKLILELGMK